MGGRRDRKEKFIAEHPWCCYCGGGAPTQGVDHNPPRCLFPEGSTPFGFRFPSCSRCNSSKKDAESRAALISSMFSRVDPLTQDDLDLAVARGLGFFERDPAFRDEILRTLDQDEEHPRTLPESFGAAMFDLGRFYGQALYYAVVRKILSVDQDIGVTFFTNAMSKDHQRELKPLFDALKWSVPRPAIKSAPPLFAVGALYFADTETLFFAGSRRGSFLWFGIAGEIDPRLLSLSDHYHFWHGDGTRR